MDIRVALHNMINDAERLQRLLINHMQLQLQQYDRSYALQDLATTINHANEARAHLGSALRSFDETIPVLATNPVKP